MAQIKINSELLISLVENRPVVWDKTLENYKDRILRTAAWREICIVLKDDFEEMEEKERQDYGKAVVKKWNQLRDSWMRSLNVTKSTQKSGSDSGRIKKYYYHNQMLFLKKNINPAETHDSANSIEINKNSSDTLDRDPKNTMNQNREHELSVANKKTNQENPSSAKRPKAEDVAKPRISAQNLEMLAYMKRKINAKDDLQNEDRNMCFFKGIIPTLDLFNDDQVLEFQAGVIHLLQDIKRRHNCSYQSPLQGYCTSQYSVSPNSSSSSRKDEP